MKIKLDPSEVGIILINWAKEKYKTHNVSIVKMSGGGGTMEAELEVTMDEHNFGSGSSAVSETIIQETLAKLHGRQNTMVPEEPDLTPDFSGATEGLV